MADDRHDWFLNQIFRHRGGLCIAICADSLPGREDIEDLVQETYLRVYALSDYRTVDSPRALLFRIAHNMAVERARRRKSQATDSVADLERFNRLFFRCSADEQIDARRRFESFCAAVDRLPPLCRRVFVLRKVYRLSHDEIAEVLGVSHSTIEKHVARALIRCRDYLRDAGLLDAIEPKERADAAAPDARCRRTQVREVVKLRTRAEIDEAAAAWVWRMDSATAADRQAFDAWLRLDPRHRRAAAELSAVVGRARWAGGGQARREDRHFHRPCPAQARAAAAPMACRRRRPGRGRGGRGHALGGTRQRIADPGDGSGPAAQCHPGGRTPS